MNMEQFTDAFTSARMSIELCNKMARQKVEAVTLLVQRVQMYTKEGIIVFNDDTAYPIFYDDTTGDGESVIGAKCVKNKEGKFRLFVCTSTDLEDDSNWFCPNTYGNLDYDAFVNCVERYVKDNNTPAPKLMAVLVTANVTTRVVVETPNGVIDDDAYEKALNLAKDRLIRNLSHDYRDCIEDVREDTEMPFSAKK